MKRENKGIRGEIKGTDKPRGKIKRLRVETRGSSSAEEANIMHEGKI